MSSSTVTMKRATMKTPETNGMLHFQCEPSTKRLKQTAPSTMGLNSEPSLFYSGGNYQLKLALLFLGRAHINGRKLILGRPRQEGVPPNLDDLLFNYEDTNARRWLCRWVQIKHRLVDDATEITAADFLEPNGRLSLRSLYEQHRRMKLPNNFPNWNALDQFLVVVGQRLSLDVLKAAGIGLHKVVASDPLLHTAASATLQLYHIDSFPASFREQLGEATEAKRLATVLAYRLLSGTGLALNNVLLQKYHYALVAENVVFGTVVNGVKVGRLSPAFLGRQFSSPRAAHFHCALMKAIAEQDPSGSLLQLALRREFTASKGFGVQKPGALCTLPGDWNSDMDIEEFRAKLFLAVDMPREAELAQLVEEELGAVFNLIDGSIVFDWLWSWLQTQMCKQLGYYRCITGGQELLENIRLKLVAWNLLGVMTQSVHTVLGLQGCFSFPRAHLESLAGSLESTRLVRLTTSCTSLAFMKVCQLLKRRTENDYAAVDVHRLLKLSAFAVDAVKSHPSYWLVVQLVPLTDDETPKVVEVLRQVIEEVLSEGGCQKKLVLIAEARNTVCNALLHCKPYRVHQDQVVPFEATEERWKLLLLDSPVAFEMEMVQLRDLEVETDGLHLDTSLLNAVVSGGPVKIGRLKLGSLRRTLPHYVLRKLQLYERFDCKGLDANTSSGILLALTGVTQREILKVIAEEKLCHFEDGSWKRAPEDVKVILFSNVGSADEHFEMVKDRFSNRTLQWFHVQGHFCMLKKPLTPGQTRHELTCPIVKVITGSAGMGKSVSLAHLAFSEKRRNPLHWVLMVNLADFQKLLAADGFADVQSVVQFLCTCNALRETFQRKMLDRCIVQTGRVMLLFDGYDQIDFRARAHVLQAIRLLKTTRVQVIWIATRRCHWPELEAEVADLRYDLLPLSRLDQQSFLSQYWRAHLKEGGAAIDDQRTSAFALHFLQQVEQLGNDQLSEWLGNPLLLQMLADICWPDVRRDFASEDRTLQLLTALPTSRLDLFKCYAEEMILQGSARTYDPQTYPQDRARLAEIHGRLAITQIFGYLACKCGITEAKIQSVDREKLLGIRMLRKRGSRPLHFTNGVVAEYFAARQLGDMLKIAAQRDVAISFLKHMYFAEFTDFFRGVLDRVLIIGCSMLEAVLREDGDAVYEIAIDSPRTVKCCDKLGRTPLHLAAMYSPNNVLKRLVSEADEGSGLELDINALDSMGFTPLCYALALVDKCSDVPKHNSPISSLVPKGPVQRTRSALKLIFGICEQRKTNCQQIIKALKSVVSGERLSKAIDGLDCCEIVRRNGHRFDDVRPLLDLASERKRSELLCVDGSKPLRNAASGHSWTTFAWIAENLHGKPLHAVEEAIMKLTDLISCFTTFVNAHDFVGVAALIRVLTFRVRRELWHKVDYLKVFKYAIGTVEVHLAAELLCIFGEDENLFDGIDSSNFFVKLLQSPYRDCYFAWMLNHLRGSPQLATALSATRYLAVFRTAVLELDRGLLACWLGCTDQEKLEMKKSIVASDCQQAFCTCLRRRDGATLQLLLQFVGDKERQRVFAFLNVEVDGPFSFELQPDMDEMWISQVCHHLDTYTHRDYDWSIWGHLIYALLQLQIRTQM